MYVSDPCGPCDASEPIRQSLDILEQLETVFSIFCKKQGLIRVQKLHVLDKILYRGLRIIKSKNSGF